MYRDCSPARQTIELTPEVSSTSTGLSQWLKPDGSFHFQIHPKELLSEAPPGLHPIAPPIGSYIAESLDYNEEMEESSPELSEASPDLLQWLSSTPPSQSEFLDLDWAPHSLPETQEEARASSVPWSHIRLPQAQSPFLPLDELFPTRETVSLSPLFDVDSLLQGSPESAPPHFPKNK